MGKFLRYAPYIKKSNGTFARMKPVIKTSSGKFVDFSSYIYREPVNFITADGYTFYVQTADGGTEEFLVYDYQYDLDG